MDGPGTMAWIGLGLLAAGCVDTAEVEGTACDVDHPCPGDLYCVAGACREPGAVMCETDGDCPLGGACFVEGGYCVSCLEDRHCMVGVCLPEAHVCVGCLEDGHCPVGVCLAQSHTCVDCRVDGDCATRLCHVTTHVCLGCKGDHECASGACREDTGICEPAGGGVGR